MPLPTKPDLNAEAFFLSLERIRNTEAPLDMLLLLNSKRTDALHAMVVDMYKRIRGPDHPLPPPNDASDALTEGTATLEATENHMRCLEVLFLFLCGKGDRRKRLESEYCNCFMEFHSHVAECALLMRVRDAGKRVPKAIAAGAGDGRNAAVAADGGHGDGATSTHGTARGSAEEAREAE